MDSITWRVHPLRENCLRSAALLMFLIAVLGAVQAVYRNAFWTLLSGALLLGSLAGFLVPTNYEMNSGGVTISRLWFRYRLDWSRFRSFCIDKRGVLLSPFERPNRLENFRGNFLLISDADQPLVFEYVRKHLREMESDS